MCKLEAKFLVLAVFLSFVYPNFVSAEPFSYYDNSETAKKTLRTVELYHLGKLKINFEQRQYFLAVKQADFVLRYFPDHPKALEILSSVSLKLKKPSIAIKYFDIAIEKYPGVITTYNMYGTFLFKQKKYTRASDMFKRVLAHTPDSATAHYNLGLTYMKLRNYNKANTHANIAYFLGYPLPGLRHKLKEKKSWVSLKEKEIRKLLNTKDIID